MSSFPGLLLRGRRLQKNMIAMQSPISTGIPMPRCNAINKPFLLVPLGVVLCSLEDVGSLLLAKEDAEVERSP